MDKPYYPHDAIASVEKLALTLGIHPNRLLSIADKADESYTEYELVDKDRTVFEPKYELKKIQKRINSRIFELVEFPLYLQGGIRANVKRDYVENAKIHANATTLISLDIKKFYTNIKADKVSAIYKYFFKFPDEVVDILTKLTTYKGKVPQGGCTSSYLANLVFFNSEYRLVSAFRGKGISYSRLLDDVTLSSASNLDSSGCTEAIRKVVGMFTAHDLKLNSKKTKIEYRGKAAKGFEVTGLWVEHKKPKLRRKERRYVRQLVYNCELKYESDKTTPEYHELWNKTSGKVAKLTRLEHSQAKALRKRLRNVLPEYDDYTANKLKHLAYRALQVPKEHHQKIGRVNDFNRLIFKLGVLRRSHPSLAKVLIKKLKVHYKNVPTKKEYWLE
ncbi:RNA-directed DNA polymerase [Vibrio parahaemolyticus]|uniref:reverse transcriptase family protein n=1 Tax=unclassified Vibrio TaxID=2614977 RepID=UPI00280D8769|nr:MULTISPECIES: reverse transcriptase family protein [unclassified Vibrio]EHR0229248.1 RNA-directed DNA polymerase [Vibrio parahaemolyticus]HDY7455117.1 RNA-directed DNA polymerase [Vibrio vulnificus]ELA9876916.1 RNA-directed DNA polymerase [Vibrio parahaemolyticus]MDW2307861.1 reverse transcriptase family protein [Vibrio sp. 1457]MDW2318372.1 reverse transcriptase family protein [Vibrio sp. 1456-1]